jgi:hypothetical protein
MVPISITFEEVVEILYCGHLSNSNNKILELLCTSGHDSTAPPSAHHRHRHPSRTACPGSSCAPDCSDPCSQRADGSRVPSTT